MATICPQWFLIELDGGNIDAVLVVRGWRLRSQYWLGCGESMDVVVPGRCNSQRETHDTQHGWPKIALHTASFASGPAVCQIRGNSPIFSRYENAFERQRRL